MTRPGEDMVRSLHTERDVRVEGLRGASRVVPPDDPSRDPKRPLRVARGISLILVVLSVVGLLQATLMVGVEVRRWWVATAEVARLQHDLAQLDAEIAELLEMADRYGDERFREHLARRQGFVFPHETRYVIIQPIPQPTAVDDPAGR